MKDKNENANKNNNKAVTFGKIIMGLCGALVGIAVVKAATKIALDSSNFGVYLMGVAELVVVGVAAVFIHLIAHEAGHLIFGLLSGYSFVSFRIGSFALVKEDGKIKHKRYSVADTGGQCLLAPPPYDDGKYPNVLYNLGGVIVNIILTLISLAILRIFRPEWAFAESFLICMVAAGLATALLNGIPYKTDLISNDGYNALNMAKDKAATRGFWLMLEANRIQMQEGKRLKDIDESLFDISEKDCKTLTDNPLASSPLVLKENRLMDSKDFDGAKDVIDKLLSGEYSLNGIYERLLKLDRLYIDILRNGEGADFSILEDKSMKKFLKSMKNFPSVIRTLYAVSVARKNSVEQKELMDKMNALKTTHPCLAEVETELDLMGEVAKIA